MQSFFEKNRKQVVQEYYWGVVLFSLDVYQNLFQQNLQSQHYVASGGIFECKKNRNR